MRHIKLHKNLLNNECRFCGKTFQKYNLKTHIRRWHGAKVISNALVHDILDLVFTTHQGHGGDVAVVQIHPGDDGGDSQGDSDGSQTSTEEIVIEAEADVSVASGKLPNCELVLAEDLTSGQDKTGDGENAKIEIVKKRGSKFPCSECEYVGRDSHNLKKHFKSQHSNTPIMCTHPYCEIMLPDKFNLKKHLTDCFIHCPWGNCPKKFKRQDKFDSHQKAHLDYVRRLT